MIKKHYKTKLILLIFFFILLIPTWLMIVGSFQNIKGFLANPPAIWPSHFVISNYTTLTSNPLLKWISNTIFSLIWYVIISVLLSASVGYYFATTRFKYKELCWSILLIGLMIPRISFIIPIYVILKKIGLSGTLISIVVSTAYNAGGVLLARNYFESIPKSLLESASIDGANDFDILKLIVTPMSLPAIATLSLFASIGHLSDYIWQMLVLQKPMNQTLLIGLIRSTTSAIPGDIGANQIGKKFAVGVNLLLPLLLIFLIANKQFISKRGGELKE